MSARDDDADREQGFLGRWIKRKAEVRDHSEAETEAKEEAAPAAREDGGAEQAGLRTAAQEPAFDLSKLPRLDEITAETNITDFMRREVPAALRNAALRQAWAIDPAIRDYVNPAREYAYDWNVPGGVPGNGPIEAGFDALKQVAEAFSTPFGDNTLDLRNDTPVGPQGDAATPNLEAQSPTPMRMSDLNKPEQTVVLSEEKITSDEDGDERATNSLAAGAPRRRHGGASPV
ncbi:MAG: DUF3306 domain-containing protein [Beijerinckiaceae bacterium]|nr:DUF3306 domain-containing protein [Beijerinckiaceae bacterium]